MPGRLRIDPFTVRQCVEARLLDHVHIAVSPVLLGAGEHLVAGLDVAGHYARPAVLELVRRGRAVQEIEDGVVRD